MARRAPINALAFVHMLKLLHAGGYSRELLATEVGVDINTVGRWLKLLGSDKPGKPCRLVFVRGWVRKGTRGNWAALWAYGYEMKDVPKPPPLTKSVYMERYRLKMSGKSTNDIVLRGIRA